MYSENVIEQFKKEIAKTKAFLDAWQKVEFVTKKNGEPFKVMQKNIVGAKYQVISYAMQADENELVIYTSTPETGYINDSISLYEIIYHMDDEKKKAKTQNFAPKIPYLKQIYVYDLDDIKEAIQKRIAQLQKELKVLEAQNHQIISILMKIETGFKNFKKNAKEIAHYEDDKRLYYYIIDELKKVMY